jgi:hypothetical protein
MKKRRLPRGAALVATILAAFSLLLHACGQDTDTCDIDCEDVSVPGSAVTLQIMDSSCEQCAKQFYEIRAATCGLGKNPNCACLYLCRTMWEFKH